MKPLRQFLVEPLGGVNYVHTETIGGQEIIMSVDEINADTANRQAVVIEVPVVNPYGVMKGDILLVHHNVFRAHLDNMGYRRPGQGFVSDHTYSIADDQWYMYKRDGKWTAREGFALVKPILAKQDLVINKNCTFEPGAGVIVVTNEELRAQGIVEGCEVRLTPFSEYYFRIDGEDYYRIYTTDVCLWKPAETDLLPT